MSKAESSKFSLVSVLDNSEENAGFGVYIGDGLVLTCAHVLQEKDNGPIPTQAKVRFAALLTPVPTTVVKSIPPVLFPDGSWQKGDVALLKLTSGVPSGPRPAPLVIPDSMPNTWLVFGRPQNNPKLTEVNGTFKISDPLPELRGPLNEDITIEPGFSGSPVFDEGADQVLGLVRSGIRRWEKRGKEMPVRQSYMLPIKTILAELDSAELEDRVSNKFVRLSTGENRKDHHKLLCKRIQQEWKALNIHFTFDYRICAVGTLDAIREIHHGVLADSYPNQQAKPTSWSAFDFLRDITRERRYLDSAIFHLQAPGGSGKSVFAKDVVQMALDHLVVPYCIDLKQSQKAMASAEAKQAYELRDLFIGTIAGGAKLLEDDLEADRLCLVLADGLNETAAAAPKWLALLRQLTENYSNLRILICDRIVDRESDLHNAELLTIYPLSREAINAAMAMSGGSTIDDPKLLDLLSTPFFLHLALPSKAAGKQPSGIRRNTRTEMFEEYFRMALEVSASRGMNATALLSPLKLLSEIAYNAYAQENHLFLDVSLWDGAEAAEFRRKLEQAGAMLAVKQASQKIGLSFRHQLLHDYLVGYYLANHTPPDYGSLHGATWRGENPEPVNFALEIIGTAGADSFLNQVYDWNYSVTIGCLRDMEESKRSKVSDFFKAAVAALIALKTADYFIETRRAGDRDLRIFEEGLARLWRDTVTEVRATDDTKIQNLLQVVKENFNPPSSTGSSIVDYTIWKGIFCSTNKPIRGEERFLFVDNPLIGWTAANSFRRTGVDSWFADAIRGAFRALREIGVSSLDGLHSPAARVARRRIVHVLGTTKDDDTVDLLEQVVFFDAKEDEDVKNDAIRSLLEIASKERTLRDRIVEQMASGMSQLAPHLRRRVLRSHRVIVEDANWRSRMLDLIDKGFTLERDERYRSDWEKAKVRLIEDIRSVAK